MAALPSPVLLTGATGFIGGHLHRHLLDRGIAVRALVRSRSSAAAALDRRCRVVTGELTDPRAVAAAVDGAAAVVYGAGAVRGRHLSDFHPANVAGVETLVEALRGRPAAVVLLSSLAASRPELSSYAASKRDGERVLERTSDLTWTILRAPAVYGPGDTELKPLLDLVRRGVALRPGPPGQRLALLHVHDLVRAVAACLAAPEACRQRTFTLHDGKPEGYDWGEIAAAVSPRRVREIGVPGPLLGALAHVNLLLSALLRYPPMLTPGKVRELQQARWLCDNRPLTHATGWQPDIDLARGSATLFHDPARPGAEPS